MGFGGGGSLWFLILAVLVVVPLWRLLPQYGIPSWVALAALIPFGLVVLLWVMAFRDKLNGGAR
ncbi:hypothetical protein HCU73_06995 [Roseibacterium sp. KMU-115]|uniref:Uncharacterized protein n=2 Tax=Roseicyclus persicicus TaxID=2650661 RepID=A0A7X6JYP6_9RHOB|nr:hypothetical protein [Roseibacterium persicicum]